MSKVTSKISENGTGQLSFRVPLEHFEVIHEHKWVIKKDIAEICREAIAEYIEKHGLLE